MRTDIFWIDGLPRGRLGISPRPRGGDWLDDEAQAWRASGVDSVVSLLTPSEKTEFGLEEEETACHKQGLQFNSLAIPDRGVPQSGALLKRLVSTMLDDLNSGKTVIIHCRQGIGRSSLIAVLAMTAFGEDPNHAFQRIAEARGRPVPDTDEQRNWVRRFAETERRAAQQTQRACRRVAAPKVHA